MSRPFRAASATVVLLLVTLSVLVTISTLVGAVSHTWTSDVDFTASGAGGSTPVFLNTQVVGTGAGAHVDIVKNNFDWANKNPSSAPVAREGPGMVFETHDNEALLFGGYSGSDRFDTWLYNFATNSWTQVSTPTHPAGREFPGFSYDPVQQVVVMFGGVNGTNGFLNDTWEFDLVTQTWSQQSPPIAPPPFVDNPLAYDAANSRHIMFGQDLVSGQMRTWAYNAATHTWANRIPGSSPGIRTSFAMAYDPARSGGRVTLFGGINPFPPPGTFLSDTWEYNYGANTWSQVFVTGPSGRTGHAMTYRSSDSSIYLFAGGTSSGPLQDTWKYSSTPAWSVVSTSTHPAPRQYMGFAWDSLNDVGVMFGGSTGGTPLGDTWSLGAAYNAAGKYTSAVFDSGAANTVWTDIWWNKTPANQPPNTFLRFQIAAADSASGPWNFYGGHTTPCSGGDYFTTPGDSINFAACFNNHRFLKFLGDFGSFDTQVTPSLEDITINYQIPNSPPYIVVTDPYNVEFGVQKGRWINVTFSKPMDTTTVNWTVVAVNPSGAFVPPLTPSWSPDNTFLTLAQSAGWRENTVYRVTIGGKDMSGQNLIPNPIDSSIVNPWVFITEKINPWIVRTDPTNQATDVPVTTAIVLTFSEAMNRSSLVVNLTPPDVSFTPVWSNGDATVTLNHASPFLTCREYTVGINATDLSNLALVGGPVPNPFTFQSHCPNPFITAQIPGHLQQQVSLNAQIIVDFSEPMATSTVTLTIAPNVAGTIQWQNGDRRLVWSHATNFVQCGIYTVTVDGRDADENLPLINNPFNPAIHNPWKFATTCSNPYIVWTIPADGDVNVSVNQEVQIFFSDQMDQASVIVDVTGGPWREIMRTWDVNTLLHIQHVAFRECTHYTFHVSQARNMAGAPLVAGFAANPWSFDTECVSPYIVSTDPVNNSVLIPVTQPVVVNFSAAMNTGSVIWSFSPPVGGVIGTWSNGDKTLTLTHPGNDFAACTQYTVFVDGQDTLGGSLLTGQNAPAAPDPFYFTTRCAGFYIVNTDPTNSQQDVPFTYSITVDFSQAANPLMFQTTVAPGVGALTPTWSNGDTRVTVAHASPFLDCRVYTVTVSAKDTNGFSLINVTGSKPNPWTFKAHCVPPQITNTDPASGATGVSQGAPIVVTFSETMSIGTVTWLLAPGGVTLNPSWNSPTNTILTLTHTTAFAANTQYCVTIAGKDLDANNLVPGPVPNPWCFTTSAGLQPPGGLSVSRASPNIILQWRLVPNATYNVYSSINRFAAWPWPILNPSPLPVGTNSYIHLNADTDGLCHFYIVRAAQGAVSSSNSTMGVKCPLNLAYSSSARGNIYWVSLPYRSKYHTAKDISDDLGPRDTKIDIVGKWNPSTQSTSVWAYFRGAWRGTNFPINPGDGIYVSAHSSFSWILNGTDGAVAHTFTAYPPPNANINWFSLPWTATYARASDVVRDIAGGIGPGTNTKIDVIAKWDPTTQSVITFSYAPGGWGGTDFVLSPGDGIYFHVVATFSWTPRLITPEVP